MPRLNVGSGLEGAFQSKRARRKFDPEIRRWQDIGAQNSPRRYDSEAGLRSEALCSGFATSGGESDQADETATGEQ